MRKEDFLGSGFIVLIVVCVPIVFAIAAAPSNDELYIDCLQAVSDECESRVCDRFLE